ncbi:hypothetical protein LG288_11585 [Idiomarina seosinensis]|uniref:hypothetical protein n=1 Tax=Idiomarina seosinensis TaxID=281739 RepID=UPI00384B75A5
MQALTEEITRTANKKRDEKYLLFKVSQPWPLARPMAAFDQEHHDLKFMSFSELL